MAYLRGEEPVPEGCLFCLKPHEEDAQAHIVHRGRLCFVVLNRFPYNNGHLMVVPYAHLSTLEDLDAETLAELMALTQLGLRVLREAYSPQGFNVGMNIGVMTNNVSFFINALEDVTDTAVLSNPKVLTLNKQPAEVIVGQEIGYITTTVSETTAVQAVEFLEAQTPQELRVRAR